MTSMVMASNKIVLLLFIWFLFSPTTKALVITYLHHNCSSNKTFSANCAFQSDRTTLLSSLASANTTAGSQDAGKNGISSRTIVAIVVPISVLIFIVGTCCLSKRIRKKYDSDSDSEGIFAIDISNMDSLQYELSTIAAATDNFSFANKIGRGSYSDVYFGMLPDGQKIAVKRHSGIFQQEFKNEIEVIAKLQHRNLVRFLGFCMQEEEKIIIYEYMPNGSLMGNLFDPERQKQLDWIKRYKIIKGIARGIQYLHEDLGLRIIHRDLKGTNILLDSDMNPKISNFDLTIIFGFDQTQGNTNHLAGTYGNMSPEYMKDGVVSVKFDVYSFGILLIEIISGKSYGSSLQRKDAKDLLSYAWKLWKDGKPLELMDPTIGESYTPNEVMRCIHIALLCVQDDPADRPSISSIILMLESYSMTLPTPSPPTSFLYWRTTSTNSRPMSVNEMSDNEVMPR